MHFQSVFSGTLFQMSPFNRTQNTTKPIFLESSDYYTGTRAKLMILLQKYHTIFGRVKVYYCYPARIHHIWTNQTIIQKYSLRDVWNYVKLLVRCLILYIYMFKRCLSVKNKNKPNFLAQTRRPRLMLNSWLYKKYTSSGTYFNLGLNRNTNNARIWNTDLYSSCICSTS